MKKNAGQHDSVKYQQQELVKGNFLHLTKSLTPTHNKSRFAETSKFYTHTKAPMTVNTKLQKNSDILVLAQIAHNDFLAKVNNYVL